ncbi:MAG TPA: hypothetical protein VNU01_02865, partial [Egibacteraceae bacterium]|nr:hypothetical protein [Egibacteraceae bacterium]
MRARNIVVVLCVVWPLVLGPAAEASVPIIAGQSPLQRLAESRRTALRAAEALRGLGGTRLPVPRPNGRWLITFTDAETAAAAVDSPLLAGTGARGIARRVLLLDRLPDGLTATELAAALPGALAVEADKSGYRAARVPSDPLVAEQWAHEQARAFEAWDTTTGDAGVLVAVIDSGVWAE